MPELGIEEEIMLLEPGRRSLAQASDDVLARFARSPGARGRLLTHRRGAEVLAENRFLAARDGMDARLIDSATRRLVPVRELLEALLAECRPHARALGCADARNEACAADRRPNGADRQRACGPATDVLTVWSPGSRIGSWRRCA